MSLALVYCCGVLYLVLSQWEHDNPTPHPPCRRRDDALSIDVDIIFTELTGEDAGR